MDEIIDIQQNHNDGGSLLGKEGLIQLWKMINDKFVTTDCTGLLWSKDVDHAFVDNISSRLDGSKVTLTLPTYNLYTKAIGSVSTVFDIGAIPSLATKADLSQCVKKSIIFGSNQALAILDTSTLTDGILSFRGGADNGTLRLYFYGSTDGETQIRIGYRATTTIPAVSSSSSGLMTPTLLNKLNNLSSGGGGPVSKNDIDKSFIINDGSGITSKKSGDNVTLTFPTYNPKSKSTGNSTISFPVGSKEDLDYLFIDGLDVSKNGDIVTLTATTYNLRSKSRGGNIVKSFQVGSPSMANLTIKNGNNTITYNGSGDKSITINDNYVKIDDTANQTMAGPLTSPAFYMTSDIALKRDVINTPISDKIASRMIQFKQFKYKQDDDLHYGVIAQEVQKILPQLVHDNDGTKIVDYISLLCLKIQDLQDQINELKSKVSR